MIDTSSLSLAAGCVQEFPPEEQVRAAAEAGFGQCGLWIVPEDWSATRQSAVLRALADTGMRVLDVEVLWNHPGAPDSNLERVIDIGAAVGAQFALLVSSDPDDGATARRLEMLCAHAEGTLVQVCLEFLPITEVRTLAQAVRIVQQVGADHAGVLIDSLHLARTGSDPRDLAQFDARLFPYLQICDAPGRAPGAEIPDLLAEAIDGRLLPGEGELPLRELVRTLPGRALSLEIRSKALREAHPDAVGRARAVFDGGARFLESLAQP